MFTVILGLCTVDCVVALGPCSLALSRAYFLVYGTNTYELNR